MQLTKTGSETSKIKMLLYGPTGSGKTWTATRIEGMKILYINFEVKDASAHPGLDTVVVSDYEELKGVYVDLKAGEGKFDVVVMDSMTEYGERVLAKIRERRKPAEPNNRIELERFEKQESLLLAEPELGIIGQAGWGVAGNTLRETFRAFRDLQYHMIFTALEDRQPNHLGINMKMPLFFGKSRMTIPSYVSFVGHMEPIGEDGEQEVKYSIRFAASTYTFAKAEGDNLDNVEPANLTTIFNKIMKGKEITV